MTVPYPDMAPGIYSDSVEMEYYPSSGSSFWAYDSSDGLTSVQFSSDPISMPEYDMILETPDLSQSGSPSIVESPMARAPSTITSSHEAERTEVVGKWL